MMLKFMYPDKEESDNAIYADLESLVSEYLPDISLDHIGFPADWKEALKA